MVRWNLELREQGYYPCIECESGSVDRKRVPGILSQIMGSRKQFVVIPYCMHIAGVDIDEYEIFVRDIETREELERKEQEQDKLFQTDPHCGVDGFLNERMDRERNSKYE